MGWLNARLQGFQGLWSPKSFAPRRKPCGNVIGPWCPDRILYRAVYIDVGRGKKKPTQARSCCGWKSQRERHSTPAAELRATAKRPISSIPLDYNRKTFLWHSVASACGTGKTDLQGTRSPQHRSTLTGEEDLYCSPFPPFSLPLIRDTIQTKCAYMNIWPKVRCFGH